MERYVMYIARQLLASTALVTLSLTSIVWLTQALRLMDMIVNQGITMHMFLLLTLLLLPSTLLFIFPVALLIAVLFTYHKLKTDSELTALQAAGLSRTQLARPAMIVAMLVTLIGYGVSMYLLPVSYRQFRALELFLRQNYVSVLLQEGIFSSPMEGLTVFVRERGANGTLKGILVHDSRVEGSSVTLMADEGQLVETASGPRFLMRSGNRQEMKSGKLSFLGFENYALDLSLYNKDLATRAPDPQEMFLHELMREPDDPQISVAMRWRAEFHQRIIWPLTCLMLTCVALSAMLTGQYSRRGGWQRMFLGVCAGTLLMVGMVAMRSLTAQHPALILLNYLILALVMGAAWRHLSLGAMRPSRLIGQGV